MAPRFTNLDGTTPDKSLGELIRWALTPRARGKAEPLPVVAPRLTAPGDHATWIGHATFVLCVEDRFVVTDPVWSTRVGGYRRLCPLPVALTELPPVDVVTISHDHYDHLDLQTLDVLAKDALIIAPRGRGAWLERRGYPRVRELGWWESYAEGPLEITSVPAHHWSMRRPWDRNRSHWGGFIIRGARTTVYHAGDTAFRQEIFAEIGQRWPKLDHALLPIGAYAPAWFMAGQHLSPEQAVMAFDLLGAQEFIAMHFGTFELGKEALEEPAQRVQAAWARAGHPESRLVIPKLGETRSLGRRALTSQSRVRREVARTTLS
jgi:L-ascorbate metabolism protein UlaG (beta-lactamase superfamily)